MTKTMDITIPVPGLGPDGGQRHFHIRAETHLIIVSSGELGIQVGVRPNGDYWVTIFHDGLPIYETPIARAENEDAP